MTEVTAPTTETTPAAAGGATLTRSFRGYDTAAVDRLLADSEASVAALTAERDQLRAKVEALGSELARNGDAEQLLRDTLVSAQRTANELRERTQAECDELLENARAQAREIEAKSAADRTAAEADLGRLRAQEQELRASYRVLLAAALDRLDDKPGEGRPSTSLLDALAPNPVAQRTTT